MSVPLTPAGSTIDSRTVSRARCRCPLLPLGLAVGLAVTALAGCGSGRTAVTGATQAAASAPGTANLSPSPTPTPSPPPTLPRGGRRIFPEHRVVMYYGGSDGPGLGVLGNGTPDQAAAAVEKQAAGYRSAGRPVLPAMELITTTALSAPGADGTYSSHGDPAAVRRYLAAARRHKELLVLDFQPGRADFPSQVKRFASVLKEPDVGVGLDSEWRMGPGQVPGQVFGHVQAAEVNAVSALLATIVRENKLPEKLLVLHQFRTSMLPDREKIVARPGLATVFHADGNGDIMTKVKVLTALNFPPPPFRVGFKVFFKQDPVLMTPAQVMALTPQPDLVSYQ